MKIPEELLPVIEWWERDGKKHLAVAGVAALAALGVWSWRLHRERQADMSVAALVGYADVDTLRDAVERYGSLEAGPMLRLKLAAAYFARREDGDLESALSLYEELSGSAPDGYGEIPAVGRAECLEALERWDDAAQAYGAFVESAPTNAYLLLGAKLGLARCRSQSGDRDGAVASLEALAKENEGDASAKERIEATIDVVKRWVKREAPVLSPVAVEQAEEAVAEAETVPAAEADATDIVLPSDAAAPAEAQPAASEGGEQPAAAPQPPAPAPEPAPAPAPVQ